MLRAALNFHSLMLRAAFAWCVCTFDEYKSIPDFQASLSGSIRICQATRYAVRRMHNYCCASFLGMVRRDIWMDARLLDVVEGNAEECAFTKPARRQEHSQTNAFMVNEIVSGISDARFSFGVIIGIYRSFRAVSSYSAPVSECLWRLGCKWRHFPKRSQLLVWQAKHGIDGRILREHSDVSSCVYWNYSWDGDDEQLKSVTARVVWSGCN